MFCYAAITNYLHWIENRCLKASCNLSWLQLQFCVACPHLPFLLLYINQSLARLKKWVVTKEALSGRHRKQAPLLTTQSDCSVTLLQDLRRSLSIPCRLFPHPTICLSNQLTFSARNPCEGTSWYKNIHFKYTYFKGAYFLLAVRCAVSVNAGSQ